MGEAVSLKMSDSTSMKEILGVRKLIPIYQRNFVWDSDLRADFLNDLVDASARGTDGTEYFIGSMVFRKNDDDEYEVVDGQQRITTILLLVSCATKVGEEADATNAYKLFWPNCWSLLLDIDPSSGFFGTSSTPNMKHADSSISRVYERLSEGEQISASDADPLMVRNLSLAQAETTEFLRNWIHDKTEQERPKAIADFLKFLLQKVVCIHHVARDMDTALTIFGRLNATGKALTRLEIMKGMSFQNAQGDKLWERIEEEWKKLEALLHEEIAPGGKGRKKKLIDHDSLLSYKLFLDHPEIGRKFSGKDDPWVSGDKLAKLLLDPTMKTAMNEPIGFVASITEFTEEILALRTADEVKISSQEIRNYLRDVAHIAASQTQWLMLAVPILRHFPEAKHAFRALRNMVFVYSHVQTGSGSSSGTYRKLSAKLSEQQLRRKPTNDDLLVVVEMMRDEVVNLIPEYEAQLRTRRYPDAADRNKIRRALEFIEVELNLEHGVGEYSSLLDFAYKQNINVDHLQPTSLGRLDDDCQHEIGNLSFLTESSNKGLGRTAFEDPVKQAELLTSPFWITKALSSASGHGREREALGTFESRNSMEVNDVKERTEEIVRFIKTRLCQ